MVLFCYAVVVTLFWVVVSLLLLVKSYTIDSLTEVEIGPDATFPEIALIVPIRNEERNLEEALTSLCQLNYPTFRLILIDDRSTDRSPEIIDHFAATHSYIQALHIQELPEGWLGKSHALYWGYQVSKEPWMLFTDADVVYQPNALAKAMVYCRLHQLDHLTIFPEIHSPSGWLNSILEVFKMILELKLRPWEVKNPRSKASLGIGAFNLLRRTAYESIGTHQSFALRPDDDLKLGEKLKRAGFRQRVVYGNQELGLEWYTTIGEFVSGLMKNTFSTFDYQFIKAFPAALLTILVFVVPVPLLLALGTVPENFMASGILAVQLILYRFRAGRTAYWWQIFMIPVAGMVMSYIVLASAIRTLVQGGIIWRGSFYSLKELRKMRKN
jgi:cellulose synthase/poly-beta-1,6-N-acetylglucosamine synthase-like glycosyltransferase